MFNNGPYGIPHAYKCQTKKFIFFSFLAIAIMEHGGQWGMEERARGVEVWRCGGVEVWRWGGDLFNIDATLTAGDAARTIKGPLVHKGNIELFPG